MKAKILKALLMALGVNAALHISDLSWTKKVKHPGEFTSVGADIDFHSNAI